MQYRFPQYSHSGILSVSLLKIFSQSSHFQAFLTSLPDSIHVNPPSFVRRLRHFNFAENLRHGDENFRHLTATAEKKIYVQFFILPIKNGTNFSFRFDILVLSRTLDLHPGLAAKCALIRDLISARLRSVTTCHPSGMHHHQRKKDT